MSLFKFLKVNKKADVGLSIKSPNSITTDDISLPIELTLTCPKACSVSNLTAKLRADLVDRQQSPSAAAYTALGEVTAPEEIKMSAAKPETIQLHIPLDFSMLDAYEIPPENMSAASEEMKAAAAATKSAVYKYSIEVLAKVIDTNHQIRATAVIELIDPHSIRASSF